MIEVALKPTQTKNQLRNVKVKQLYITLCDVQTQHEKNFQHFAGAHVEKMLRLSNRRGRPARELFEGLKAWAERHDPTQWKASIPRTPSLVRPLHISGTRAAWKPTL